MKKRAKQRAAPLAGLELDARRAERVRTVEALRAGRTPLTLIDIADHGARVTEEGIRQAATGFGLQRGV